MGTMNTIQERMRQKAFTALDIVEFEIDKLMDKKTSSFSMLKYLRQLGYSGRVVAYMKGCTETTQYELKNEEKCEQLEEAYSFLTPKQKEKVIKKLQQIEDDIVQFCNEYKPVRKVRIKTPAQLVKKLPYKQKFTKYESINPEEIIRARILIVYITTTKKLTKFEGQGLSVRGSRITGYDLCEEKTLTDLSLLDRLVSGGNIIAQKFMDEIPRSKLKEGNDRITKNIILVKVVK